MQVAERFYVLGRIRFCWGEGAELGLWRRMTAGRRAVGGGGEGGDVRGGRVTGRVTVSTASHDGGSVSDGSGLGIWHEVEQ